MVTDTRLHDEIDEILPGLIADRRYLHEHPELGFQEHNTARFVAERLAALGVDDIRTGINQTGVTGLVRGMADGPGKDRCVLVRADMDALPIPEENDVEYKSQNEGVMHACGHDAHTAILLGLARTLMSRRDQFAGTVKLLFQPSEEMFPGGAKGMIEAGVLEDPHVDASFALHMANHQPLGVITIAGGPIMASPDACYVTIQGKGGHAAAPHRSIDPIVIGAQIVNALQTIVSRNVDPIESCVVTVGKFQAGEAFNVIPDTAELGMTIRTLTPEMRDLAEERVKAVITGVAEAGGATVQVNYIRGYPATVNNNAAAAIVAEAATGVVGEENVIAVPPSMGGEDYAYFLLERPGAMFQVGSKNEEKGLVWAHHHPRFDIDEESLAIGLETMAATVLLYLERGIEEGAA
jgi:amidohydrolase